MKKLLILKKNLSAGQKRKKIERGIEINIIMKLKFNFIKDFKIFFLCKQDLIIKIQNFFQKLLQSQMAFLNQNLIYQKEMLTDCFSFKRHLKSAGFFLKKILK